MTAQDDLVALVMAATADRLAEIEAAKTAAEETQARAAKALEEAGEMHATAVRISAQAEADRQNLAGKQAELEKFEQTLSDHNQALTTEKAAWENIREKVDTDQKNQAASLAKWNDELIERETAVHNREVDVVLREKAATGLAEESAMRIRRLREALYAVDPPVPPAEEPQKDAA